MIHISSTMMYIDLFRNAALIITFYSNAQPDYVKPFNIALINIQLHIDIGVSLYSININNNTVAQSL